MTPITDLRKLKPICKKFGLMYHQQHKYIILDSLTYINSVELFFIMNKEGYALKYFSGCFYPYLIKVY